MKNYTSKFRTVSLANRKNLKLIANNMGRPTYSLTQAASDVHLVQELAQHIYQGTFRTATTQQKQQLLQKGQI